MQAQKPPLMPSLQRNKQQASAPQEQQQSFTIPEPKKSALNKSPVRRILPAILMTTALAGVCLLAYYAYEEAAAPRDISELPVIKADAEPYKIEPSNPGGMEIPNLDKSVYDTINSQSANQLVASDEKANIVKSEEEPIDREKIKEINDMAEAKPVSKSAETEAASEEVSNEPVAPAVGDAASPAPAELANENGEHSDSGLSPDAFETTKSGNSSVLDEEEGVLGQDAEQVLEKAQEAAEKAAIKVEPKAEKKAAAPAKAKAKQAPAKKESTSKAPAPASMAKEGAGNFLNQTKVQLGAFKSTSEAKAIWSKLKSKNGSLLNGLTYGVQKADLGSKGVFYRLHAGPFKSANDGAAFCKKLSAQGQGCFVVK